jgi:hypothetical protein
MRITHLLFVDDVLIFCSGRVGDTITLEEILSLFHSATRMKINAKKSTLTISEMEREEVPTCRRLFPYSVHDILEGIKYLGFI